MMTFDELWPVLGIPGEFDAMDQCDQMRWRGVLQQAFDAGQADAQRTAAVWENEAREQALQALASEGQWMEQTGAQQKRIAELEAQRQWQPIETAPRDGSLFLCWVSATRYGETDEGQQYQQDASQIDFCSWREGPPDMPGHGYFDPCCGQIADSQDVTHWMPLPPPPVERAHGIEEAKR